MRDRAGKNAEKAGVADKIELRIVEPGPLPFADQSFDAVFSKDSMIHIEDKPALFREVLRVLRPGGAFVASDWLSGEEQIGLEALERFKSVGHLSFTMATAAEMAQALVDTGLQQVETRDRNAWYAKVCAVELAQVEGPLKAQLVDTVGEEIYASWLKVRKSLADAVSAGGLRPTHLRGFRPATRYPSTSKCF
ncbi:MAG TPA: methyltransferase domain-containing protein [Gammaproteobacteria bacterium]|nr:methyltransferase domain-containing protein [Gammaproteobacteria bacterium]